MSFTSVPLAGAQSSQSATFITFNYPLLGNTHIAVDLNGDGRLELVGSGASSVAVTLNNGGGNLFIHWLLLEHFADMYEKKI